eukprot:8925865-Lingulodinium_polyedra.AAC.1
MGTIGASDTGETLDCSWHRVLAPQACSPTPLHMAAGTASPRTNDSGHGKLPGVTFRCSAFALA